MDLDKTPEPRSLPVIEAISPEPSEALTQNTEDTWEDASIFQKMYAVVEIGSFGGMVPGHITAAAYVYSTFMLAIILLSCITIVVESLPEFINDEGESHNATLNALEIFAVSIFTFDIVIRLASCPNRKQFFMDYMNWVDILSVLPFYIDLGAAMASGGFLRMVRVIRLVRTLRVLKAAKYHQGLQVVLLTLGESVNALSLFVVLLAIGLLLFSTAIYYAERGEYDTETSSWMRPCRDWEINCRSELSAFQSIPHAFWWCLVTLTTVGFGDMYPVTEGGRAVASFTTIAGMFVLAFPIMILSGNFEIINRAVTSDSLVGLTKKQIRERWLAAKSKPVDDMSKFSFVPAAVAVATAHDRILTIARIKPRTYSYQPLCLLKGNTVTHTPHVEYRSRAQRGGSLRPTISFTLVLDSTAAQNEAQNALFAARVMDGDFVNAAATTSISVRHHYASAPSIEDYAVMLPARFRGTFDSGSLPFTFELLCDAGISAAEEQAFCEQAVEKILRTTFEVVYTTAQLTRWLRMTVTSNHFANTAFLAALYDLAQVQSQTDPDSIVAYVTKEFVYEGTRGICASIALPDPVVQFSDPEDVDDAIADLILSRCRPLIIPNLSASVMQANAHIASEPATSVVFELPLHMFSMSLAGYEASLGAETDFQSLAFNKSSRGSTVASGPSAGHSQGPLVVLGSIEACVCSYSSSRRVWVDCNALAYV